MLMATTAPPTLDPASDGALPTSPATSDPASLEPGGATRTSKLPAAWDLSAPSSVHCPPRLNTDMRTASQSARHGNTAFGLKSAHRMNTCRNPAATGLSHATARATKPSSSLYVSSAAAIRTVHALTPFAAAFCVAAAGLGWGSMAKTIDSGNGAGPSRRDSSASSRCSLTSSAAPTPSWTYADVGSGGDMLWNSCAPLDTSGVNLARMVISAWGLDSLAPPSARVETIGYPRGSFLTGTLTKPSGVSASADWSNTPISAQSDPSYTAAMISRRHSAGAPPPLVDAGRCAHDPPSLSITAGAAFRPPPSGVHPRIERISSESSPSGGFLPIPAVGPHPSSTNPSTRTSPKYSSSSVSPVKSVPVSDVASVSSSSEYPSYSLSDSPSSYTVLGCDGCPPPKNPPKNPPPAPSPDLRLCRREEPLRTLVLAEVVTDGASGAGGALSLIQCLRGAPSFGRSCREARSTSTRPMLSPSGPRRSRLRSPLLGSGAVNVIGTSGAGHPACSAGECDARGVSCTCPPIARRHVSATASSTSAPDSSSSIRARPLVWTPRTL